MIDNLEIAITYFTLKYEDTLEEKVNIRKTKTLYSQVESLDKKFFEREYSAFESGLGVLVREQERRNYKVSEKYKGHKICVILEKEIKNPLGTEDYYYYYVIYRNKTLTSWANTLDLKKYSRKPGFYLPFSILKHIEDNKKKYLSELVLMLNMPNIQPQIFTIKSEDLFKYFTSNKLPLLISEFGVYQTAVPLEIMDEMKL